MTSPDKTAAVANVNLLDERPVLKFRQAERNAVWLTCL